MIEIGIESKMIDPTNKLTTVQINISMFPLLVGYFASILLAISLIVNNDLKFRWLNTLGCVTFIGYGILINALPVILTNSLLFLINGFYLLKIYRTTEHFDLLEFEQGGTLINKFLSFYQDDIKDYFPVFDKIRESDNIRFVVTRDLVIANIFVASLQPDGSAEVHLNFTVAKYRDYKVGKFIFEKEKKFLISKGVKQLFYLQPINSKHQRFLIVMGFREELRNEQKVYIKNLG